MSHFSVLVVTDQEPTTEVLRKTMQPWHEFECTGTNDKYVQEVDQTQEYKIKYERDKTSMLVDSEGKFHDPYKDVFYRVPTEEEMEIIGPVAGQGWSKGIAWVSKDWGDGKGYSTRVRYVPTGFTNQDVPIKEVKSFRQYLEYQTKRKEVTSEEDIDTDGEHKYGYTLINRWTDEVVRTVNRTNPNSKWDWWRVGGRFRAKLQARVEEMAMSSAPTWEFEDSEEVPQGVDQCQVSNLDLILMKAAAVRRRKEWAVECVQRAKVSWQELELGIEQCNALHKLWLTLDVKPRGNDYHEWMKKCGALLGLKVLKNNWELPDVEDGQSLDEWVQAAPTLYTFAVVMNGEWYAKGEMGWWAAVSNENKNWDQEFDKLLNQINRSHWVSVLDCHI